MTAPIPREIPGLRHLPVKRPGLLPSPVPARAVMAPVRRPYAAAYRLALALTATGAVTVEIALGSPTRILSHFAVQSTALLAVVTFAAARRSWTGRQPLPGKLTGAALLYVVITGLVHHLLLADATPAYALSDDTSGPATLAAHVLHTAVPVAALLDWLILTPPARTHLRHTATWMLYPLAYLAFSLTRGELLPGNPARYLYPFLDVTQHGYKGVLGNALLLGLAFYALAVLLVVVDHTRPNPVRRRPKTGFRLRAPVG
ncbi:Pr6Pr family membrane protein [Streptomyces sp. H28]|uniref:Pr6Pr family membrane protein n=1 Tax=Streptomyces sp. H28 TaxID=2775865 RepID=UPI00178407A5|nr:Pr6Pr family membrane protein [Streptomyces sp. H28]MBD9730466.1 Pr6Pr family membrane protein [Streptomyces sp. H28]